MAILGPRGYAWFSALSAALCTTYYGYDASMYNAIQGDKDWVAWLGNPSSETIGGINTAYSVAAILSGFFIAGTVADKFGRKVGMGAGSIFVLIGAVIETATPKGKIGCFIVGRAIVGVALGLVLAAGPSYIGEITPSAIRGIVMTFWQVGYSIGMFLAFWTNYACQKYIDRLRVNWDWRIECVLQCLVPCYLLIALPFMATSARWCLKHDYQEKALAALISTRATREEAEEELRSIREALEFEKRSAETASGYSAIWKDKSVLKRFGLAVGLNVGQQITGQGSLATYSTKVYQKVFASTSTIALINALNATCAILFCLNVTWIVERWGRKVLFIIGGIGMAVCMLVVATVETQTPNLPNGAKTKAVGVAIVFLLFLFIFFYKPSWGAVTWIWSSEVFSMNVRAQCVGMAGQTQSVANAIVQQFFPTFLDKCGFYAFYMFAGINCLLVAYVFFLIPETKGVPLEEMDALFGGANHVTGGQEFLQEEEEKGVRLDYDETAKRSNSSSNGNEVREIA